MAVASREATTGRGGRCTREAEAVVTERCDAARVLVRCGIRLHAADAHLGHTRLRLALAAARPRPGRARGCLLLNPIAPSVLGSYPSRRYARHRRDEERKRMNEWIVMDPAVLGGKPCIKGTRISVAFILELLASGASRREILEAYPHVTDAGLTAALAYAARSMNNEIMVDMKISA
jgi:uncharacterized protein (DUF433 family)